MLSEILSDKPTLTTNQEKDQKTKKSKEINQKFRQRDGYPSTQKMEARDWDFKLILSYRVSDSLSHNM